MSKLRLARPQLVENEAKYLEGMKSQTADLQARAVRSFEELLVYSNPRRATLGTHPELQDNQWNINGYLTDLNILYEEALSLGSIVSSNFNEVQSVVSEIEAKLSKIRSLLADYRVYSLQPRNGILYLGDTFDDVSKVDTSAVNEDRALCSFDGQTGIATLPKEKEEVYRPKSITFNAESNGVSGNNNEYGTPLNNNYTSIFDGNIDTWFEYEHVGDISFVPPLVLSFTLTLQASKVINYITISSVNFGTKDWPTIQSISTSNDGIEYMAVEDNQMIVDWGMDAEEDLLSLGPGAKKTGVVSFAFTPRKAKYVKFVIQQANSYTIHSAGGYKERWAIGIKDISIQGITYQEEGEFQSKSFVTTSPLRRLALASNQNPDYENSVIGTIEHYTSIDGGQTWEQISPIQFNSNTIDEIIDVGSSFSEALEVDKENILSVRYKGVIRRLSAGFEQNSAGTEVQTSETLVFPQSAPYTLTLKNKPTSSIVVLNPLGGECTEDPETAYFVGYADGDTSTAPVFQLPFDDLSLLDIHVAVGYEEWTKAPTLATSYISGLTDKKVFHIDYLNKRLEFGSGGTNEGERPSSSRPIYLWFGRERIHITVDRPARTKLRFASTGLKKNVQIYRESGIVPTEGEVLPKGTNKIQLSKGHIWYDTTQTYTYTGGSDPYSHGDFTIYYMDGETKVYPLVTHTDDPPFQKQIEFIDGWEEFQTYSLPTGIQQAIDDRVFSVDQRTGTVYVPMEETEVYNEAMPFTTKNLYIDFRYYARTYVPENKWDFDSNLMDKQSITIDESCIGTEAVSVSSASWSGILDGGLVWDLLGTLPNAIVVKSIVPKTIIFTNDSTGLVEDEWTEIPYIDGQHEFDFLPEDQRGYFYSVNYSKGKLYSAATPWKNGSTTYTIQFQFTNYYAEYKIGLPLKEDDDWILDKSDTDGKSISFTNEYGIRVANLIGEDKTKKSILVHYNYIRDDSALLKELADYYTPYLKEYRIIAVTEDGMRI